MPLTTEMQAHFEAVLEHLETERQQTVQQMSQAQARLKELNNSIVTLQRSLNPEAAPPLRFPAPVRPAHLKYAKLSVRWAILDILHDSEPMSTAALAEALIKAGVQSKAESFVNSVSAILSSTMKEKHHEVEQLPDGRWQLTETGISAIEHIRGLSKFRRACG